MTGASSPRPLTLAAVDCGTNSIRLLITRFARADAEANPVNGSAVGGSAVEVRGVGSAPVPAEPRTELAREMRIVRLGEGVDRTRRLSAGALERTRVALSEFAQLMRQHGVDDVRMVATSATRDATNREDFFEMTAEILGAVVPGARAEVISGEEEAELSFRGATADGAGEGGDRLVVDLGGGSTELITGDPARAAVPGGNGVRAFSADIGCVRITEKFFHTDPPTVEEVTAATEFIRAAIEQAVAHVPLAGVTEWIGVAGTVTTCAALILGLERYDPAAIHGSRLQLSAVADLADRLVGLSAAQRRELGPVHEGRADVLAGGALVLKELCRTVAARSEVRTLTVSETDILDGLIGSLRARNL